MERCELELYHSHTENLIRYFILFLRFIIDTRKPRSDLADFYNYVLGPVGAREDPAHPIFAEVNRDVQDRLDRLNKLVDTRRKKLPNLGYDLHSIKLSKTDLFHAIEMATVRSLCVQSMFLSTV